VKFILSVRSCSTVVHGPIWPGPIKGDPLEDADWDTIESLDEGDAVWQQDDTFWQAVQSLEQSRGWQCNPMHGYRLVCACRAAGYDPDNHGYRLAAWLLNHIARALSSVAHDGEMRQDGDEWNVEGGSVQYQDGWYWAYYDGSEVGDGPTEADAIQAIHEAIFATQTDGEG